MNHLEDNLQKSCVTWFRYQFPQRIIFAVPNGGKRNLKEAARMKRQGVTAGVPDLCIPEPTNEYHGLWVELKVGKNKLTGKQSEMIQKLSKRKYATIVCYSLNDFIHNVKFYFSGGDYAGSVETLENAGANKSSGSRDKKAAGEVALSD